MPRSLPITIEWADVFHVGTDVGTPVDDADFQSPFPFTGKLEKLTIKVGPEQLTPEDRELLGRTIRHFD
jgi:arylsulfatase